VLRHRSEGAQYCAGVASTWEEEDDLEESDADDEASWGGELLQKSREMWVSSKANIALSATGPLQISMFNSLGLEATTSSRSAGGRSVSGRSHSDSGSGATRASAPARAHDPEGWTDQAPRVTTSLSDVFPALFGELNSAGGKDSADDESSLTGGDSGSVDCSKMDGSAFLYRVALDDCRVLITLDVRDALINFMLNTLAILMDAIPELSYPSQSLQTSIPAPIPEPEVEHLTHDEMKGGNVSKEKDLHADQKPSTVEIQGYRHPLFSVEVSNLQVQIRDEEQSKSCLIVSIEEGAVQGWVGLDQEASDPVNASMEESFALQTANGQLQKLAQRLLPSFQEAITVTAAGFMLSVAPSDVDLQAGTVWLPSTAFPGSPTNTSQELNDAKLNKGNLSAVGAVEEMKKTFFDLRQESISHFPSFDAPIYGVFKPIMERVEGMQLQVLTSHGVICESSVIQLSAPVLQLSFDPFDFRMLLGVLNSVLLKPLPLHKHEMELARREQVESGFEASGTEIDEGSVTSALTTKKAVDWETRRRQALLDQVMRVMTMLGEASQRHYVRDLSKTPSQNSMPNSSCGTSPMQSPGVFRRKRSDQAISLLIDEELNEGGSDAVKGWSRDLDDMGEDLHKRSEEASDWLRYVVKERKLQLRQKPNIQMVAVLRGCALELKREDNVTPFIKLWVMRVRCFCLLYDDDSGSVDVEVGSLWMDHFRRKKGPGSPRTAATATPGPGSLISAGGVDDEAGADAMVTKVVTPLTGDDSEYLRLPSHVRSALRVWSPKDAAIRLQAQVGSPVGGIILIRHVEVTVTPLVVRLTRMLFSDISQFLEVPLEGTTAATHQAKKEEKLKATFLAGKQRGKGSKVSSALAHISMTMRKSVKGSADGAASANATSSTAFPRLASDDAVHLTETDEDRSSISSMTQLTQPGSPGSSRWRSKALVMTEQAGLRRETTDTRLAIKHMRLGEINVFASYSGKKWEDLEDFQNMHLKLHPLVYSNKTWTVRQLVLKIRKDIILDSLGQVSRNFSNLGAFLSQRMGIKPGTQRELRENDPTAPAQYMLKTHPKEEASSGGSSLAAVPPSSAFGSSWQPGAAEGGALSTGARQRISSDSFAPETGWTVHEEAEEADLSLRSHLGLSSGTPVDGMLEAGATEMAGDRLSIERLGSGAASAATGTGASARAGGGIDETSIKSRELLLGRTGRNPSAKPDSPAGTFISKISSKMRRNSR
ncbi:unnamed protein product, partial [Chrysoparadoxa australica]